MARSLLVVPAASHVRLARTCLGLVRALDRLGVRVGFVKPVSQPRPGGSPDRSAALIGAVSSLHPPEPLSTAEVEFQLGAGGIDAVLEQIVGAWQPVYDHCDVVIIEGLSPDPARLYAGGLNQALAAALDADVVLAGRWPGARPGETTEPAADIAAAALADILAIAALEYASGEDTRARCRGPGRDSDPERGVGAGVRTGAPRGTDQLQHRRLGRRHGCRQGQPRNADRADAGARPRC